MTLRVEICRMNPDLSMGDELLKKTGAGNLFMVFGEPDIELLQRSPHAPREDQPIARTAPKNTTASNSRQAIRHAERDGYVV